LISIPVGYDEKPYDNPGGYDIDRYFAVFTFIWYRIMYGRLFQKSNLVVRILNQNL